MEITSSVQYWQIKQTKTLLWDELFLRYTPGVIINKQVIAGILNYPLQVAVKSTIYCNKFGFSGYFFDNPILQKKI